MREYSLWRGTLGRVALVASSVALVTLAACGEKKSDATLATDTALGRDLAMAQQDIAAQPKLQDVPAAPPAEAAPAVTKPAPKPTAPKPTAKPTTPAPTPAAPAPAAKPITGTVAAGTTLRFTSNAKVCSNGTAVGDKFTATLTDAVDASNGVKIPDGATGTFEVTESKTAQNSKDVTTLKVKLVSVTYNGNSYPVESTVQTASTERVRSASKGTDAKKVAGGAIIGAIAGQVIGKNTKGTVIGAAAGAAAGTAAAAATANYDTCLGDGGAIAVVLDAPVTVKPAAIP